MTTNPWVLLGAAILLEVVATSLLNASQGMTRLGYGLGAMIGYGLCFWLLAGTLTRIPVGIAYAIWSGAGIVAITIIGWAIFRQQLNLQQVACIGLILAGAVGLNLLTEPGPGAAHVPEAGLNPGD